MLLYRGGLGRGGYCDLFGGYGDGLGVMGTGLGL